MKITILGTGYVGLVTGACFSEMGNTVTCTDTNKNKIAQLKQGTVPIYEPGLSSIIEHNMEKGRLIFSDDKENAIRSGKVIFICVGTPASPDGSADLRQVYEAASDIGKFCENHTIAVTKSTVPVGTTAKACEIIRDEINRRKSSATIDIVNNPEFLKEGRAVSDFMGPDRVVVGTDSPRAARIMKRIYSPFQRTDERIIFMSIPSSELTKYASNAMLATRISFMNEMALLAESVDADIEDIRKGIAMDRRIGKYFLYAGAGYGGSCFPKDVSALIHVGKSVGLEMRVVSAANTANVIQKSVMGEKVLRFFKSDVMRKKIALWGLAFKPETDDIREAPALEVARILRKGGAFLAIHDPEALENTRAVLGDDSISYHTDSYDTLDGADALIIMTEWKEYRTPDWERIHDLMTTPAVFDGRNLYDPEDMKELGFRYFGIGHGEKI